MCIYNIFARNTPLYSRNELPLDPKKACNSFGVRPKNGVAIPESLIL